MYQQFECQIPEHYSGQRLDQALAALFSEHSRARWQQWIRAGHITLDGVAVKPRLRLRGGEHLVGRCPVETQTHDQPQALKLSIVHHDSALLVIDKPVGLVVHPAAGHHDGTLVNALLHYDPGLANLPRAGLVHRLDKDTSGLLVVARTLQAHTALVTQLQARRVSREYRAVVTGVLAAGGTVNAPLGRHPVDRKRMAVVAQGKPAVTHYRVRHRFRAHSELTVKLDTGRTHQIRVHLAHIRYPLLGDPVYGGRPRLPPGMPPDGIDILRSFQRQALHAERLGLVHPLDERWCEWQSPLPSDLQTLLAALHTDQAQCLEMV